MLFLHMRPKHFNVRGRVEKQLAGSDHH